MQSHKSWKVGHWVIKLTWPLGDLRSAGKPEMNQTWVSFIQVSHLEPTFGGGMALWKKTPLFWWSWLTQNQPPDPMDFGNINLHSRVGGWTNPVEKYARQII